LKNEYRFRDVSGIAYIKVINKSLKFLILWKPKWVSAKEYYKSLKYLVYTIINDNDSTVLACWDFT
jgi:hypothetical protein